MTSAEIEAFLADKRHGVLATNARVGAPQISPVWYLYRDGKFYVSIGERSVKSRNLKGDPRVSLLVDGAYPDARYVAVYGTAEIVTALSPWRKAVEREIVMRYHESTAEAEAYLTQVAAEDSVLVIITPDRISSRNYN